MSLSKESRSVDNIVEFIDQEIRSLTVLMNFHSKSDDKEYAKEMLDFYRGWKHGLEVLKNNIEN